MPLTNSVGATEEYEYEPSGEYFIYCYKLYKGMSAEKERYTLFLHDTSVEPTNNLAERYARKFKRKAAQAMCFRSQEGVNNFCDGLSVTQSIRAKGENLYESVSSRFNRGMEVCQLQKSLVVYIVLCLCPSILFQRPGVGRAHKPL